MRRITGMRVLSGPVLFLGAVLVLVLGGCNTGAEYHMVGQSAPDFSLKDLQGKTVRLQDFRGRLLLMEFWAPWCGHCRKNIEPLRQIKAAYGQMGLVILGPSLEQGRKTVSRFAEQQQVPYRVVFADRDTLARYGVSGIPVTVLVDAEGVVRYWHAGPVDYEVLANKIRECLL